MLIESKNIIIHRNKTVSFLFVLLISIIIIVSTIFSFKNKSKFFFEKPVKEFEQSMKAAILDAQLEEEKKIQEMTIDSDSDGLTDYLEKNVYGTSPYISDTDGDGLSDKEEIDAGSDPLCPSGQVCSKSPSVIFPNAPQKKEDSSQYTNEEIEKMRAVLRTMPGVDLDFLATIDNKTVIGVYEETVGVLETMNDGGIDAFLKSTDSNTIKEQLISSGFPREDVEKMTDAEIKEVLNTIVEKISY